MEAMTGPLGSSAGVPRSSCAQWKQESMVLFSTRGMNRTEGETDLVAVQRDTEEDDAPEALLHEGLEELLELVHAPPALAGEGGDLDARVGVVGDEDGVHEHGLCEGALSLP